MALTPQEELELLTLEKERAMATGGMPAPQQPSVPAQQTPVKQSLANRIIREPSAQQSRNRDVAWNAAKGAVPGVIDMFLNAPVNALNLGNAAIGTIANFAGKSDYAPALVEPPNYANRFAERIGFTSEPANPQTNDERYIASTSQGAASGVPGGLPGMVLGGISGFLGELTAQKTGNPAMGVLAGTAVYPTANAIGNVARQKLLAAEITKKQKAPFLETLNEVKDAGYLVSPAESNPTFINRALTALGGKSALRQDLSLRNEQTTENLVRKGLRAPAGMPIDEVSLANLADQRAQPYREVADLPQLPPPRTLSNINPMRNPYPLIGNPPPPASELLRDWKAANTATKAHWKEYDRNNNVAAQERAVASQERANALAAQIEEAATFNGRPELVDQLRAARVDLAKIGNVERAANLDRGEVNAASLTAARNRGVPLTGELETIAKMGNTFPQSVQSPRSIGVTTGNTLGNYLGTGLSGAVGSGVGYLAGGPWGASAGGAAGALAGAAAPALARRLLMSKIYQRNMTSPNYEAGTATKIASNLPVTDAEMAALRGYLMANQLQGE